MDRPISVLLLDDKADSMKDFILEAKSKRVLVEKAITNAKVGIRELQNNHKQYDAIILDAYFFEEPDSATKKSPNALADTIREIDRLADIEGRIIPHCIYTGEFDEKEKEKIIKIEGDSVVRNKKVFVKGRDQKKMFSYLKDQVSKSKEYSIKNKFNDVFEVFDYGFIEEHKLPDLIEILKKLENQAKFNHDDAFTPLRKMYEAFLGGFYKQAMKYDKHQDFIDERLVKGGYELTGSWRYFSGMKTNLGSDTIQKDNNIFPKHLSNLMNGFLYLTNKESHYDHSYKYLTKVEVSHYAYKSAVYALLELLLWYKNFCLENFK